MLTDAQTKQFADEGFLVIPDLWGESEVTRAKDELSAMIAGRVPVAPHTIIQVEPGLTGEAAELAASPETREAYVRKLQNFVPENPVLTDLARESRLVSALTDLLGPDVKLYQSMSLLKPARYGSSKLWHQDAAFFQVEPRTRIVGVWIALDEATAENGCMQVLPGSHNGGFQAHRPVRTETFDDIGLVPGQDFDPAGAVAVPLPPGGALFFDGLTLHSTGPNHTDRRRRALQLHYVDARIRYTGEGVKPEFFSVAGQSYPDGL